MRAPPGPLHAPLPVSAHAPRRRRRRWPRRVRSDDAAGARRGVRGSHAARRRPRARHRAGGRDPSPRRGIRDGLGRCRARSPYRPRLELHAGGRDPQSKQSAGPLRGPSSHRLEHAHRPDRTRSDRPSAQGTRNRHRDRADRTGRALGDPRARPRGPRDAPRWRGPLRGAAPLREPARGRGPSLQPRGARRHRPRRPLTARVGDRAPRGDRRRRRGTPRAPRSRARRPIPAHRVEGERAAGTAPRARDGARRPGGRLAGRRRVGGAPRRSARKGPSTASSSRWPIARPVASGAEER